MMRLKVESSSKDAKKLKEKFVALASSVESENWESGEITLVPNINNIYYHIINIIILIYKLFTYFILCRFYLLIQEITDKLMNL